MWIDDVVTHTTIRSVWGNGVRNQLCQAFDTIAERDSRAASVAAGSLAYVAATDTWFVRRAASPAGWQTLYQPWTPYTPIVLIGGINVSAGAVVRCVWRRQFGTTADLDVVLNVDMGLIGGAGAAGVSLPVAPYPTGGDVASILGGAYLTDFGHNTRLWGPAQILPSSYMGFVDPATGAQPIYGPAGGALLNIKVRGSYECIDG